MTKPDDIPQRDIYAEAIDAALVRQEGIHPEVWDAANELSVAIADDSGWMPSADAFDQIVKTINDAIMAEREACAKVAEADWELAGPHIAAAIRNRGAA